MTEHTQIEKSYLRGALNRAEEPVEIDALNIELLDGGRTGAEVLRLSTGNNSYVLKIIPKESWRAPAMGKANSGEALLSNHLVMQRLPAPVFSTLIDISSQGSFDYLLMRDVATGIRDRGKFTRNDTLSLFHGLANMHGDYYQSEQLDNAPLPSASGTTKVFTTPLLSVCKQTPHEAPWVAEFLDGFKLMNVFAPMFLELIGSNMADAYLDLVADEDWKKRMDELPATFLHGDLRRANMAFSARGIDLFDWELASKGPPGVDLQWHCFLHYWGYPPDGVKQGDDCDDLRDAHKQRFKECIGDAFNPQEYELGWKLGWIRAVVTIGYILTDPLYPDGGDTDTRKHVKGLCLRAIQRALDMRENL